MSAGNERRRVAREVSKEPRSKAERSLSWVRRQMGLGMPLDVVKRHVAADPVVGQFPRKPRDYGPFFRPEAVPSRFLVVENVVQVNAGTTSATYRVEFAQGAGWLVGWRGTTVADGSDAGRSSIGVSLNFNGSEPVVTNGTAEDFALFEEVFPKAADWSPLMIPVDIKDVLKITFRNLHSVNNYTPHLCFAFRDGVEAPWFEV